MDSGRPGARAFLDSNALFGALQVDLLLTFLEAGLIDARWSTAVVSELERVLLRRGVPEESVTRRLDSMAVSFPSNIYRSRPTRGTPELDLPDPDDAPIIQDAHDSACELIVTWNIKHFPKRVLLPLGLRAITPDQYLTDLLSAEPGRLIETLDTWLTQRHRPAYTRTSLVERLREVNLVVFAEALSAAYSAP